MLTSYLSSLTRGLQGINEVGCSIMCLSEEYLVDRNASLHSHSQLVDKFDVVAPSYSESAGEGQKSKDRRSRVR